MRGHGRIRKLLHDYTTGELEETTRRMVEQHLLSCPTCAKEADDLHLLIRDLVMIDRSPAEERSDEFWRGLLTNIERDIGTEAPNMRNDRVLEPHGFPSFLALHWRPVLSIGGALALVGCVVIGWHFYSRTDPPRREISEQFQPAASLPIDAGLFFRKSKALLIGLANMKTLEGDDLDFSVESEASRDLVRQTRYLRAHPLAPSTARLINDLDKIFVAVENMKPDGDVRRIRIVQGAIHHENLLFKIRMAEALHDTAGIDATTEVYSEEY